MLAVAPVYSQRDLSGSAELRLALERLNVTGSVLMIGAHPDDENTALLAYFARGRKLRTGYLSLTRGEGGQNLIGPEQGDLLGVIRTQELLAARKIDGAEQFFTRAIDFGFTKTVDETLAKWGREKILGDIVWVIRAFRPDVVVLRFSGTPRDGHGQHQASAILGKEAFQAAADPKRFPEQLRWVRPWRATRLVWNVFSFTREQERDAGKLQNRVEVDAGEFDPVLGHSYGEVAGMSRSRHRSQGMGSPERRGSMKNFLVLVEGEPASRDVFDGVDVGWHRVSGGEKAGEILARAAGGFEPRRPESTIPLLIEARKALAGVRDPIATRKLAEIDETIALSAGLWLDANAARPYAAPGGSMQVTLTALNRSQAPVKWIDASLEGIPGAPRVGAQAELAYNLAAVKTAAVPIPADSGYSQPYWLQAPKSGDTYTVEDPLLIGQAEGPAALRARFRLDVGGQEIELVRPVEHRYVDRVYGELTRPFEVAPAVALKLPETAIVFANAQARNVEISAKANTGKVAGRVRLEIPPGWKISPAERQFQLSQAGEQTALAFEITPPSSAATGEMRAVALVDGKEISAGMVVIDYPHIPAQTVIPPAVSRLVRTDARTLAKNVGYVMGAGDEVPEALRQLGCEVTLLTADDLVRGDLGRFDAVVTGVRAYNVRADLRANQQRLLDYVKNGGTLVVQYNVLEGGSGGGDPALLSRIGPFPIRIGRERVTVEEAPVSFPDPRRPVLARPNHISERDFEGWVQERGLYFASEWAPEYQPLLESHDPGERPLPGGTLYAKYGHGAYIFTAYSWFRQLPAGVPGAYRIFANFISAGKIGQ